MAGLPLNQRARLNRYTAGRPFGGKGFAGIPLSVNITVQGLETVLEHWFAAAPLLNVGARGVVEITGQFITALAKDIHKPHIDTQATYNSIGPSDRGPVFVLSPGSYATDIGPRTQQARFLEWGFVHNRSGKFIQYPFMIPASDAVRPIFFDAMSQLVETVANRRVVNNPIAQDAGFIESFRAHLYSASKAAGDLSALGLANFSGLRSVALIAARGLGDVEAVMRGALSTRVYHRVSGRFASGTLTARVDAIVQGPTGSFTSTGQRILNRFSGFTVGRGFGNIDF